ncbi:hypothetical protein M2451_002572 [Dysgonomonas sp. PFB1-18]|uniref:hypothetical protein n=1 Tax=unclassified Dysgonomonas TaxID=2630389 RepID=UPI0024751CF8|nr:MULTISPECIES: hypothetical protein [unclassified Dysgonomonas]MDH6308053.1 hypothetical protein [Dysgonomonas sp. PF1-14]MDH6339592.1 hypothetical protein [Dysgonomonas sp. PF1-16]MDH6381243.1 hypothetical protein [Dysgonomonas sp. PFB1-18]MDH6398455.1 hypothetical protein [Dysgonomonas sp. PF1-23]
MNNIVDFEDDPIIGSADGDDLFDCEYSSVDALINEVIVFTGVKTDVQTENGLRTLVAFGEGSARSAFFTESKRLKDVVCNPDRVFPFRAIIKVVRFGNNTGFKFFSPSSPITQQDKENFDYYKRNKYKRNR